VAELTELVIARLGEPLLCRARGRRRFRLRPRRGLRRRRAAARHDGGLLRRLPAPAGVADLAQAVARHRQARIFVGRDDADLTLVTPLPVPRAIAWEYHIYPRKRKRWQLDAREIEAKPNAAGRAGVGWEVTAITARTRSCTGRWTGGRSTI